MTREQFLAERKQGIGGSDIASVLGIGNWACARRLFFDKTGIEPDFDNSDKPEFRRGRRLEPVAAEYYREVTNRKLEEVGNLAGDKPYYRVSMDRVVRHADREPGHKWFGEKGYLEIKTLGRFSMQSIKKSGLYDEYQLQVQYGCAVLGLKWGSFAIYCPDTDELLHWDFEADQGLGKRLLEAAEDFWLLNVQTGISPDPLPEGAKPCEGCEYRIKCRQETA